MISQFDKLVEAYIKIPHGPWTHGKSGPHESKKDKSKRPERKQKHKKREKESWMNESLIRASNVEGCYFNIGHETRFEKPYLVWFWIWFQNKLYAKKASSQWTHETVFPEFDHTGTADSNVKFTGRFDPKTKKSSLYDIWHVFTGKQLPSGLVDSLYNKFGRNITIYRCN